MIMEERINVAELLMGCPHGMELDCTMFEDVQFISVEEDDKPICIRTGDTYRYLTKFGTWTFDENAKCVIFPKGKTTWKGFAPPCEFKDGDIVATMSGNWIGITVGGREDKFIPTYCIINSDGKFEAYFDHKEEWAFNRLATKKEKQKLFQAIKDNGYKWNTETKTLEKLVEPKFKVGDIVKTTNKTYQYVIKKRTDTHYTLEEVENKFQYIEPIIEDKNWELVPNKFDINTLKPFDKVLVRDENLLEDSDITDATWSAALYSHNKFGNNVCPYVTTNGHFAQCVPYKCNEHLLGTTDDCDEYYKTWE